jgi:hypothetical protein
VVPKDGINYMDTYSYDYTVQFVPQSRKMLSDLLGGR